MRPGRAIRGLLPSSVQSVNRLFIGALIAVFVAVIYRYCWLDAQDPYKCDSILNQGHWLDPARGPRYKTRPYQLWDPPGCLLHEFKAKDINSCFHQKRIVLAGDSTIRQIYWAIAKKMDLEQAEHDLLEAEKNEEFKHRSLRFVRETVELEFLWDPYLNSSSLHDSLMAYSAGPDPDFSNIQDRNRGPALMLLGAGQWYARFMKNDPLKQFKEAMDKLVPFMTPSTEGVTVKKDQSLFGKFASSDLLLLAPVQVPLYDKLSPARAATMTPERIDPMVEYMQQLSANQGLDVLWSYALMTHQQRFAYEEGGLHVVDNVAARKADVLLNLRCNAGAVGSQDSKYPYDRTCCTNYGRSSWFQLFGLWWSLFFLPLIVWVVSKKHSRSQFVPSGHVLKAALLIFSAICYCFYADRTQIFNKTSKNYSWQNFRTACSCVLIMGILSIQRSGSVANGKRRMTLAQPFLSRFQTDEWKGWMQFVILIYHYTGASKILWIYEIIRILVASYLFLTGFGHTMFFMKNQDYSLKRVALVMIRLNLLSCILPYMMRSDYLFYYFAPLVSFWFMVVYMTMRVGHTKNDSMWVVFGKILVSAILVNAFHRVPGLLEFVFGALRVTCGIHWNVAEWRFRLLLDGTIVYVGMIFAILLIKVTSALQHQPTGIIAQYFRLGHIVLVLASIIVIPGFWIVTRRSPDKADYNWWEPYISCLPIMSFIILRNSHRHFRNFHSTIFAWLGRCSLETFTLQYHIWLAADTKGLLSIGVFGRSTYFIGGRLGDFLILTPIFLWVSWRVADSTGVFTTWIVDGGEAPRKLALPMVHDQDRGESSIELKRIKEDNSKDETKDGNHSTIEYANGQHLDFPLSSSTESSSIIFPVRLWKKDLRIRIASLLIFMWVLNWTCT